MGLPTKNCQIVLNALNSEESDKVRFDANDIAKLCGISFYDARRAALWLADQGFLVDTTDPRSYFAGQHGFEVYELTEKGKHPKAFQRYQTKEFLKTQAIAILALIVAIIGLFR